jgi:hypothetical protein
MSTRKSKRSFPPVKHFSEDSNYPDGPPSNDFEGTVHALNNQAFSSSSLSRVDDCLVYTLFSTKRKQNTFKSFKLEAVSEDRTTSSAGIYMANVIQRDISHSNPTRTQCRDVAERLCAYRPSIFHPSDLDLMEQCVFLQQHLIPITHIIIRSLLLRYSILHSEHSPVKLCKVIFGDDICAGLEATKDIPAACYILSTCSSMSAELYDGKQCLSVICSDSKQKGPQGDRLILGPFRFANHDCQPNCQVY